MQNMVLPPRQHQIAQLVAEGLTNKEIAERCGIAEQTVKNQLHEICLKLDVHKRTHIALLWLRLLQK